MVTMRKNTNNTGLYIILTLMAAVLLTFAIYRLGPFPTIPIFTWNGLRKADVAGEMITPDSYELSPNLMIVSSEHPLDESMVPPIEEYRQTGVYMASGIRDAYGVLSDYIRTNMNNTLYIESSYRSFEDQQRVYNEEGPEIAALPGCSEHQSGLALDVYVMYFGGSAFINSDVGRFVNSSCGEFGFIIRYPLGAEDITGFAYEPWHIRYVGFPHSEIIMDNGITLEEYIDSLDVGVWYRYEDYIISRQSPESLTIPAQYAECPVQVSPDNTGFCVVTLKVQ